MCTAVDSAPLEAEALALGLDRHRLGMHLDLAATEARHPEARSGLAHCIAGHCIAARPALAAVPDPPERLHPLRACPWTGPAHARK